MNSKISEKDKKTWEEFLSNNQKLIDKDKFQSEIKVKKTRKLDLHGKTLEEANQIIENFTRKSYEDKIHKLIIVTGKGLHSGNGKAGGGMGRICPLGGSKKRHIPPL